MLMYSENMRYAHFAEISEKCGNKMKHAANPYSHKTDMPNLHLVWSGNLDIM